MASVVEVEKTYQDSIAQLHDLANSDDAAPAQRKMAREALNDLLLQHATHVIQEIEGRTAMLTGLIAELEGVVREIEGKPKLADALKAINGTIAKARDLFDKAKDELRQG